MQTKKDGATGLVRSGFLRSAQVLELIPVGRSTWWRWVKEGKAPRPVKLSERITVWRTDEILQFAETFESEAKG